MLKARSDGSALIPGGYGFNRFPEASLPAFLCAAAALLWGWRAVLLSEAAQPTAAFSARSWLLYAAQGESLVHGVAGLKMVDARLPLSAVAGSWVLHSGISPEGLRALLSGMELALVLSVGVFLDGSGVAALSAAGLLLLLHQSVFDGGVQAAYALLVLTVAAALVRRAASPSLGRTVALAACLGTANLFRSSLAFFAPLLVAADFWRAYRTRSVFPWKQAAVLILVPCLFLAPWVGLNYAISGRFVPFEKREADCNVITGALGVVGTVEGSCRNLLDASIDPDEPGVVLRWAVGRVGRHPTAYALSVLRRMLYVVGIHPWLWMLAAAGLWLCRADVQVRTLALLGAYFTGVHCMMSVQESYFQPLLPVLALLATNGASALMLGTRTRMNRVLEGGAGAFLWAWGGVLLFAVISTFFCIFSFSRAVRAGDLASDDKLDRELRRSPADAWLHAERGRRLLLAGDVPGAARDLEAGAGSDLIAEWYYDPLMAERLSSHAPAAPFVFPRPWQAQQAITYDLVGALVDFRFGRRDSARERIRLARADDEAVVRGPRAGPWKETLDRLGATDDAFFSKASSLSAYLSDPEAESLYDLMAEAFPGAPWRSRVLDERVLNLERRGRYAEAVKVLDGMISSTPKDAARLGERGLCRYMAGDKEGGVRDLSASVALSPDRLASVLSLGAALADAEPRRALAVYDAALARTPRGAELRRQLAADRGELLARHPELNP